MKEKLLEIKNLSFKYSDDLILDDINFDVYKGDYIALIGSNGAGKSTLIKLILNQLNPLFGTISFYIENGLKDIGYVPQLSVSASLEFPITVTELLSLSLYPRNKGFKKLKDFDIERIENALNLVGMAKYRDRLYTELSGGQRQRVLIAKALVSTPEFLILDEPMTGVDKESKESLFHLLSHINREHNITILMITHDLDEIEDNVNKVFEIKDKKIREVE
ncbi:MULTISPECIES: metal ABC transporter ATP-binding protein [Peptoniphilus]|uniref:metal ABC transporter ATP-binding protein n=1 Tax=Peptoniphilus TaxID=162289 RepID=UPI000289A675|nr:MULTISPECIES: ABC transporter ATP-binding protein [Peptoniphilus]MDU1954713.1 ABC transporter ATP-binding protein [Peptoniphilus lacydonensis]MDU2109974.1 ABC transporter ATP-binding protein [Peptoniphilus lacydonensis]MDU3750867.1 ABC transporter ATP-binding protein [Peptoniphilus rhinitidis]MDU5275320.1 ABC transporter ATP-binding protein [Peptoniphilus lacydonensis]MDU5377209.1 ABC transporter ATP-binding protein [Peptoniphilus lacydonensis]